MEPTFWQKLFNIGWSKDKRPSPADIQGWLWGPGNLVYEGNSNVAGTNPAFIHQDCFNIGWPGDVPESVVKQFHALVERHEKSPIKKACIQVGGNMWTWQFLDPRDVNLGEFKRYMREIAVLYKSILPGADIVLTSLPFVDPALTLGDMHGIKSYPKNFQKKYAKIKLNDIFVIASLALKDICEQEGVVYLDIFTPLKMMWGRKGRGYWWDVVHYATRCQMLVCVLIRHAWGLR